MTHNDIKMSILKSMSNEEAVDQLIAEASRNNEMDNRENVEKSRTDVLRRMKKQRVKR